MDYNTKIALVVYAAAAPFLGFAAWRIRRELQKLAGEKP